MRKRMRLAAGAVVALAWAGAAARLQAQECREGRAPGTVVRGMVLDSVTRVPLQRADVRLAWQVADGTERSREQETDAGGRFRFCGVPADRLLSLRADYSEPGRTQQLRVAADDSAELELEAQARPSQLRGRVVRAEDGQPLASAQIRVLDTPLDATSDGRGQFEFARIPPGTYRVHIEQLGYGARTDSVVVALRSSVELVASLAPAPVRLPPLTVDVRSHDLADAGFYDRKENGPGTFLVRQQWERRFPSKPSDVVRAIPGIRVQAARGGFDTVVLDRRGCAVRYFLDGVRTNPTFQLDEINVEWIEALEIYRGPAEVPPQFTAFSSSERATCGVIVIWTRRR